MAKRIIWSARAKDEKTAILKFWRKKNKSNVYPKKLNRFLKDAVKGLAESPIPRKKTDYGDAYVKIVRDYLIIFEEDNSTIYILSVWDTRQDPTKLRKLLE
jgi:toxin YoeB